MHSVTLVQSLAALDFCANHLLWCARAFLQGTATRLNSADRSCCDHGSWRGVPTTAWQPFVSQRSSSDWLSLWFAKDSGPFLFVAFYISHRKKGQKWTEHCDALVEDKPRLGSHGEDHSHCAHQGVDGRCEAGRSSRAYPWKPFAPEIFLNNSITCDSRLNTNSFVAL